LRFRAQRCDAKELCGRIERHLDALDPQKREVVILTEMLG
jgi:hypothetical protein